MALHLIKLCVGCESPEQLEGWIEDRLALRRQLGEAVEQIHTTRMVPRRMEELEGGSLYWVMKGMVRARQKLMEIRPFTDDEGIGRCHLVLEPKLIRTEWQPRRPFQGWRYLKPEDAPRDASGSSEDDALPDHLKRELHELGLL